VPGRVARAAALKKDPLYIYKGGRQIPLQLRSGSVCSGCVSDKIRIKARFVIAFVCFLLHGYLPRKEEELSYEGIA
jgi:hypothetical protein